MRETVRRYGKRVQWSLAAMGLTLAVTGCVPSVSGIDRAGETQLAVDIHGCPDFSGTYDFPLPGDEKGVSYQGSMLESVAPEGGNRTPASEIRAVSIRRLAPGTFEFRFMIDDARVMRDLSTIREYQKPRYREWYHLLRDPQRAAYIARNGAGAHARQVLALGPATEIVREVRAGTTAACRKGWLELPRQFADPIRLTLGEDLSILGESDEMSTFDIPIWCGDGCKDLRIPTGTYTGTLRWPRNDATRPWRAEDIATRFVFERPIDEIEAEVRALEKTQRRSDARRYLSAGDIRARLEQLAPAGTVVETVEVRGGKVHVRYSAPTADMDMLLNRVATAGSESVTQRPQQVQRIVTSSRPDQRSVEFELTDSPIVRRDAPRSTVATGAIVSDAVSRDPTAGMIALSVAPAAATSSAASTGVAPDTAGASVPPTGYADPLTILRRVGTLFPAGCRVVDVHYGGERVTLTGHADHHRCVSDALRALDAAQSRPELLSIASDGSDRYRFRIMISPSALTRR